MDRAVNVAVADPLQAFLTSVRLRLWARRSQQYLRRFYWQIAALLLVSAGVHHLLMPVPHRVLIVGSIILLAIALSGSLRDRPTLAASAAFADRQFGGHALLATALECRHKKENSDNGVSRIILQQAGEAARSWSPRVASRFRSPPATATVLAIVPLFAGLVLLSLPGKETADKPSAAIDRETSGFAVASLEQSRVSADEIATLRNSPAQEGPLPDSSRRDAQSADASMRLTPRESAGGDPGSEPIPVPEPAGSPAGVAATTAGDNDSAGDARPSVNQPTNELFTRSRFDRRELIELQRTGAIAAAGEKRNATFTAAASPDTGATLGVLPAAAPETQARSASLTAAQAAYARRYLAETGKSND